VVRAAGWHIGDPGSIPGRDDLYTFGGIPLRFESASAEILRFCYFSPGLLLVGFTGLFLHENSVTNLAFIIFT
jgi:hypothetical protein